MESFYVIYACFADAPSNAVDHMTAFELIVGLADALAWPIVAAAIAIVFKTDLRRLLERLREGRFGPFEGKFADRVNALENADAAVAATPAAPTDAPPGPVPGIDPVAQEPQVEVAPSIPRPTASPRDQVINAASFLDGVIAVAKKKYPDAPTQLALMRALQRDGLIVSADVNIYKGLRTLRNQVIHNPDFVPTADSAESYVELAGRLMGRLQFALAKAGLPTPFFRPLGIDGP